MSELRAIDGDLDALLGVDADERAADGVDDAADIGDGAQALGAGGATGPVEIETDLVAHDVGLLLDLVGEPALVTGGLVVEDAQGSLQGVGEVADLGAGALDDLGVGLDHEIELAGDRLDLLGIVAADAVAVALADRVELAAQELKGAEAVAHLDDDRAEEAQAKDAEDEHEGIRVSPDLALQLVEVAGDENRVLGVAAFESVALLDAAQLGGVGVEEVEAGDALAVARRELDGARRQLLVEKRGGGEASAADRPAPPASTIPTAADRNAYRRAHWEA